MQHTTGNKSCNSNIILGIVALAVATRVMTPALLGHPSNFAPVGAIALFSGAYLGKRALSFIVPIVSVIVGDLLLNTLYYGGIELLYPGWYWQYVSYIAIVGVGLLLRDRVKVSSVGAASISSSVLFFLVTNFGVWLSMDMYPHTPAGLALCYTAALPFFGGTLVGDLFFSALMFGSVKFARRRSLGLVHSSS